MRKIINYHLQFGVFSPYKYIPIVVLCFIHVIISNTQVEIAYLLNETPPQLSLLDYIATFNMGSTPFQPEGTAFELPALWMANHFYIVIATLIFSARSMRGVDQIMLIKGHHRTIWYYSNCIYIFSSITIFYMIQLIVFFIASWGVPPIVSPVLLTQVFGVPSPYLQLQEAHLFAYAWLSSYVVVLAISYLHNTILLIDKQASIIILVLEFGISSFVFHHILILNGTMLLRSKFYFEHGIPLTITILLSAVLLSVSIYAGVLIFSKQDIINEER